MRDTLKKMKKNNSGFTLMEMIIVVAIIAILVALIAPNLTGFLSSAETTSKTANAKSCYTAASAWAVQQRIDGHAVTATSITVTKSGVTAGLSEGDPKTDLETALDCKTFGDATLTITLSSGTVTKVEWKLSDTDKTTYPTE